MIKIISLVLLQAAILAGYFMVITFFVIIIIVFPVSVYYCKRKDNKETDLELQQHRKKERIKPVLEGCLLTAIILIIVFFIFAVLLKGGYN